MKTRMTVENRTTREHELEFDDLKQFIEGKIGRSLPPGTGIEFKVQVPGGGDWSNCWLDVGHDHHIIAVITEVSRSSS